MALHSVVAPNFNLGPDFIMHELFSRPCSQGNSVDENIPIIHFPDFVKEGHVMDVIPFTALMHLSILSPIGKEEGIRGGDLDILA